MKEVNVAQPSVWRTTSECKKKSVIHIYYHMLTDGIISQGISQVLSFYNRPIHFNAVSQNGGIRLS